MNQKSNHSVGLADHYLPATLSLHEGAPGGTHLDLFLDFGEGALLETFGADAAVIHDFVNARPVVFYRKNPHRRVYLDYTGEISGGRGQIAPIWRGKHKLNAGISLSQELRIVQNSGLLCVYNSI